MRKKIVALAVVFTIIVLLPVYLYYLQFGRDMDVRNSFATNSSNYKQERINVVLNKLIVTNSNEELAQIIIQKVLENDFHTIRFDFENGYPNELTAYVYKSKNDIKSGDEIFSFSYRQVDGEIGEFDISDYEHMILKIYE